MQVVLMIIGMTALLLVGDYLIKYATESKHPVFLSCIAYSGWHQCRGGTELVLDTEFSVVSIVGTTLIGIIGFKEKLCGTEIFGLVLAISAMILLARKI